MFLAPLIVCATFGLGKTITDMAGIIIDLFYDCVFVERRTNNFFEPRKLGANTNTCNWNNEHHLFSFSAAEVS